MSGYSAVRVNRSPLIVPGVICKNEFAYNCDYCDVGCSNAEISSVCRPWRCLARYMHSGLRWNTQQSVRERKHRFVTSPRTLLFCLAPIVHSVELSRQIALLWCGSKLRTAAASNHHVAVRIQMSLLTRRSRIYLQFMLWSNPRIDRLGNTRITPIAVKVYRGESLCVTVFAKCIISLLVTWNVLL